MRRNNSFVVAGAAAAAVWLALVTFFGGAPSATTVPAVQRSQFYAWLDGYIDQKVAAAPLARATTYYFKNGGSDANDCLSTATACATIDKANTLVNASSGGVRVRLRRGDVFRQTVQGSSPNQYLQGLIINKANCTVDDYSDETTTGTARTRKPIITPYITIANTSWALDGTLTNSYKCTITALTGGVNAVAWFRETLETGEDRVFTRRTSSTNVNNNPGSFYYDAATNTLWMRPFTNGADPTASWHGGYEYLPQFRSADFRTTSVSGFGSAKDATPGVYVADVAGCRIENIRVDGWLMTWNDISTAVSAQAIQANLSGTNFVVVKGCEVYGSAQHLIMKGDVGSAGGGILGINCVTSGGMAVEAANSRQVQDHLISYSSLGGAIGVWVDCTGVMGRLPSETYNDFTKQGEYVRCHSDGVAGHEPALMVAYRCKIKPNFWQPQSFGIFANMPTWVAGGDTSACRAFKVQCDFDARQRQALDDTWWSGTTNCVYNTQWDGAETIWLGGRVVTRNVKNVSGSTPSAFNNGATCMSFFNVLWDVDFGWTKADVIALGITTGNCRWYYSRFRFRYSSHSGSSQPQFKIGQAYSGGNSWANSAQGLKAKGNVFEIVGAPVLDDVVVSGLGNNLDSGGSVLASGSERELANVWIGGWSSKGTASDYWGTSNDSQAVYAAGCDYNPLTDSPLVVSSIPSVEGLPLEHDWYGQPRNSTYPTLGPVQALPMAQQVARRP